MVNDPDAKPVPKGDELPGRIFIVRHGERLDEGCRNWALEYQSDRTHDTPLTDNGRHQGHLFGAHVLDVTGRPRGDENFTVVTSPLIRAVDTAHHIAEVLGVSRLLVDEAMIEVGWYMEDRLKQVPLASPTVASVCRDMVRGGSQGRRTRISADESALSPRHVTTTGVLVPQGGVALSREALKEHVSPLVCTLYTGITPSINPVVQNSETGVLRRANGEKVCCLRAAVRGVEALASPVQRSELPPEWKRGRNHTLILVGHGDSIYAWCRALIGRMRIPFPYPFDFNCFVELRRRHQALANKSTSSSDMPDLTDEIEIADGGDTYHAREEIPAMSPTASQGLYKLVSPYFGTEHLQGKRAEQLGAMTQQLLARNILSATTTTPSG